MGKVLSFCCVVAIVLGPVWVRFFCFYRFFSVLVRAVFIATPWSVFWVFLMVRHKMLGVWRWAALYQGVKNPDKG
jgi:ABC-type polysaccharide/polyol phosphate export permease